MSAFIVSDGTMDLVVSAAIKIAEDRGNGQFANILTRRSEAGDLIGAKLYALNHEAVAQRYDEGESSTPYRWQPAGYQNRVRWYKAIQCLRYQCAEGDAPETPLYAELTALERIVASYIIDELPAYKEAPWDADRRDPRHAAAR